MSFNVMKCKHLSITRKKNLHKSSYFLGNNIINKSNYERDLGVIVNSKLSWHDQVISKVNTANKVLRLVKRTCGKSTAADVIRKLYLHLVRPHLDYASQVRSPHQVYLSDMIDAVQRRATKLMVGNKLPYKDRLWRTNLMSLSSRRIYLDLLFLFKCLHGHYDLDISNYLKLYDFEHESYDLRNTELTFKIPYARTNIFKFSFFPRVARLWNSLLEWENQVSF